jgi:galactose mutarotase-like enzyme
MIHTLSNEEDNLVVTINSKGAEILSIYNKHTQLDYLWNGNPDFWPKTSPVLFPVVGGLKDNSYTYKEKTYTLGRHGFARDTEFEVTEQSNNSITLTATSNEKTLAVYPFEFIFSVQHTLVGSKLYVSYIVENNGDKNLLFSVGAHPAFNVPLTKDTNYNDWYLLFNHHENTGQHLIATDGLIQDTPSPFFDNTTKLPLTKELFYKDALVFKHLHSNSISIVSDKSKHGLKVDFDDFPYMGIWSFKDADFVCIEPWCGLGDTENTTGELEKKEGIISLIPKGIFTRTWFVETF